MTRAMVWLDLRVVNKREWFELNEKSRLCSGSGDASRQERRRYSLTGANESVFLGSQAGRQTRGYRWRGLGGRGKTIVY